MRRRLSSLRCRPRVSMRRCGPRFPTQLWTQKAGSGTPSTASRSDWLFDFFWPGHRPSHAQRFLRLLRARARGEAEAKEATAAEASEFRRSFSGTVERLGKRPRAYLWALPALEAAAACRNPRLPLAGFAFPALSSPRRPEQAPAMEPGRVRRILELLTEPPTGGSGSRFGTANLQLVQHFARQLSERTPDYGSEALS